MLQQYVQPTHQQQQPSVHVWAGITLTGKTELVVLNRKVTGERYAELLRTQLLSSATRTFRNVANWNLQHDNAPSHRASVVTQLKEQLEIRTPRWPSKSPDTNPIELV